MRSTIKGACTMPSYSEYLSQDRRVAGIFYIEVDSAADVIEKGFKAGVAIALVGLTVAFSESG